MSIRYTLLRDVACNAGIGILERMTVRYIMCMNRFTRRNYDDIHNPLDTFARARVLKYSDISRFMAKLVAAHPSRGDVRHNSIISSFGKAINISNVSNVSAGRSCGSL